MSSRAHGRSDARNLASNVGTTCCCFMSQPHDTCLPRHLKTLTANAKRETAVRPATRQTRLLVPPYIIMGGAHKTRNKRSSGKETRPCWRRIPSTSVGFFYPSGIRPTSAGNYAVSIPHGINNRPLSREELNPGESSVWPLPNTAKFLHAYYEDEALSSGRAKRSLKYNFLRR